ncbi:MAG TPA: hypothetical protein VK027_05205 [Chitinophagaceae bacterium]|nr:hypothetical protein [Chitinophagaceae bacterium]
MEKYEECLNNPPIHYKLKGRHGTHAPFVYDFVTKILRNPSPFKSFLGRYFIPVTRNSDIREQKKRFIKWYEADMLWELKSLPDFSEIKACSRILFFISSEKMKGFLKNPESKNFLEKLEKSNLDYAFWTESKDVLPEFYPYFNRFMAWKEASLYLRHQAFYEKEVFLLK